MATTSNFLAEIVQHKRDHITDQMARFPFEEIKQQAADRPPTRGFASTIMERIAAGKPAVIAELKKASPSKGVIRKNYDPAAIAVSYEKGGATCLSVLTDRPFFQGSDDHLRIVRAASSLPVLRKDFTIDPYQVYEARAIGADCILLIVAILNDHHMRDLAQLASELDLDVLVEIHNREELERGLMLRMPLIGINNRDLHTFNANIETTIGLLVDVLHDRTVITESGVHTREHVALMRRYGVNAFLIGEAFMSSDDPGKKLAELFADSSTTN
ncbi:MAG: indole-3-glycerol phosphate synthase TrpC [Gammaproteobacteria bacterium]|nr:indole-3-glycerol phosphate synthase TrpC [Gammaproteobacteria bacterium]MCI0590979.1 indole-3-glycerol phosphate synthase TrpC [Gammaproteobacteria bacterium]